MTTANSAAFVKDGRAGKQAGIVHRRSVLNPTGGAGISTATDTIATGPCRVLFVAVDYTSQAATTDLLLKADKTTGATIFTLTNVNTDINPTPVGTAAIDEGGAATAATDAIGGGFPVKDAVFIDVAQADVSANDKTIVVDIWYKPCTYARVDLVAQSGADGTGAVTQLLDLHGAGVVKAITIDYQNTPATADLLIKAESTSGQTLFTRTNSQTDLAVSCVGMPGIDEGNAAVAATDGLEGGWPFKRGLFFDLAQTDIFTGSNEHTIVELWIDR